MISKIIGGIFLILCIVGCLGGGLSDGSAIIFIILGGLGILLLFKKPKSKEEKLAKKQKIEEQKEQEKRIIPLTHMAGLPIAQGILCQCVLENEMFTFSGEGNTFNLRYDKVTSLSIKTDVEIQQQYVSSIGGAVGGAVLFGPLGAMVGGRTVKKTNVDRTYYLIFTYLKDGNVDYISFEIPYNYVSKAQKIKTRFDNEYKQNISATVDL